MTSALADGSVDAPLQARPDELALERPSKVCVTRQAGQPVGVC